MERQIILRESEEGYVIVIKNAYIYVDQDKLVGLLCCYLIND